MIVGELVVYALTYTLLLDSNSIGIVLSTNKLTSIVLWTDYKQLNSFDTNQEFFPFKVLEHSNTSLINIDSCNSKHLKESRYKSKL